MKVIVKLFSLKKKNESTRNEKVNIFLYPLETLALSYFNFI